VLCAVSSLTELVFLDLSGSNVTDEGLQALSSLATLTDLYLIGCFQVTAGRNRRCRAT
jgi:hypothetical protein